MVASLITKVGADHFDARADHVATVSLAHEIMLLVGAWFWCSYWSCCPLQGHTAVGTSVVVMTPPERARGSHRGAKA